MADNAHNNAEIGYNSDDTYDDVKKRHLQHYFDIVKQKFEQPVIKPTPSYKNQTKKPITSLPTIKVKQPTASKKIIKRSTHTQQLFETLQKNIHVAQPAQPELSLDTKHDNQEHPLTQHKVDNNIVILKSDTHHQKDHSEQQALLDELWQEFTERDLANHNTHKDVYILNDIATLAYNINDYERASQAYIILLKHIVEDNNVLIRIAHCYSEIKRYSDAAEYYKQAIIKENYSNINTLMMLASSFVYGERYKEALGVYHSIGKRFPDDCQHFIYQSITYDKMGDKDNAFAVLDKADLHTPNYYLSPMQRGLLYKNNDDMPRAVECFDKAIALSHNDAELFAHRANAKNAMGDKVGALEDWLNALKISPHKTSIAFNAGWHLLSMGYWKEGLKLYSKRMERKDFTDIHDIPAHIALWNGEELQDKTLLLHSEQGHGDSLMCIRYYNHVKRLKPKNIIIECTQPLYQLFSDNQIGDIIITNDERSNHSYDYHLPMMELPRIFDCTIDNIPYSTPYLHAPNDDRLKIKKLKEGPAIGVVWRGSHLNPRNQYKSIELETLLPLFELQDCNFFSLQRGDINDEITSLGLKKRLHNIGNVPRDFNDLAAILQQCDLLISVCTAPLHLAGAIGIESWALLDYDRDWRWVARHNVNDKIISNWYDNVELLECDSTNNWDDLVQRTKDKLLHFITDYMRYNN